MRASEILRKLADVIDSQESGQEQSTEITNRPEQAEVTADNTDNTETTTMVAPLQQKIELLKKVAGVDSIYDDECGQPDELDIMKQNAGIKVATMELGDDEPFEG
jgi:hypothetical protein